MQSFSKLLHFRRAFRLFSCFTCRVVRRVGMWYRVTCRVVSRVGMWYRVMWFSCLSMRHSSRSRSRWCVFALVCFALTYHIQLRDLVGIYRTCSCDYLHQHSKTWRDSANTCSIPATRPTSDNNGRYNLIFCRFNYIFCLYGANT